MKPGKENILLRSAALADLPEIMDFNVVIHQDKRVPATIQDLVESGKMAPRDFLLAKDTITGKVVSSCCLMPQNILYGGIPLKAGQPELVGTDPGYRKMGLVSQQFTELHRWSEARGDDVQLIAGIPNFYRQFGYEMTISLNARRVGSLNTLDNLPDTAISMRIEPAVQEDIPALISLFAAEAQRVLVAHDWSELDWRYALLDNQNDGCAAKKILMIRRPDGTLLGAIKMQRFIDEDNYFILGAEIDPALTSWEEVEPAILRFYKESVHQAMLAEQKPAPQVGLQISNNHPLVVRLAHLFPQENSGYAWFVRVPHLLSFLKKVTPVLDSNLQNSAFAGLNRLIRMNAFSLGFELEFERGKLTRIDPWQPASWEDGDFLCPEKVFYHMVFGHRSFAELHAIYADCYDKKGAGDVMDALFPKRCSYLYPVI
jgi:predicted N-acetyltransferase YhbS